MSAPATAFMVAWMEANKPRMWELMMARAPAPEAAFAEVFDGAMQAHLLLAGEALAARLGGEAEERLHAARTAIADRLTDPETLARERVLVLDAALREARLQHGELAGEDRQIRDRCERRAAMMAPMRRLTLVLDEHSPAGPSRSRRPPSPGCTPTAAGCAGGWACGPARCTWSRVRWGGRRPSTRPACRPMCASSSRRGAGRSATSRSTDPISTGIVAAPSLRVPTL